MATGRKSLFRQGEESLDNGKSHSDAIRPTRPILIGTDGRDDCWTVTPWQEIAKDFFKRWLPWGRK